MADLNLFGAQGFQEPVVEVVSPCAPEPIEEKATRKPPKRKARWSGHEIFSFLVASTIIAVVIWFFVLRKTVSSTIIEYTPDEFELYEEDGNG